MPSAHRVAYQNALSHLEDQELARELRGPRAYWYTSAERVPCFQFPHNPINVGGGMRNGVHYLHHNFSADRNEPVGNSGEFPWKHPAGIGETNFRDVQGVKVLLLPEQQNGLMWPVIWAVGGRGVYWWRYPVGAQLFELLFIKSPQTMYLFEMRRRVRTADDWESSIFVPFESLADVTDALGIERTKLKIEENTLTDGRHSGRAFTVAAAAYVLPAVSSQKVHAALSSAKFTEVQHRAVPLTQKAQRFHVVPFDFRGHHMGATGDDCRRCHRDVGLEVATFNPAGRGRDWYGLVRSPGDGIFSMHVFDHGCISRNGQTVAPRIDSGLTARGIIARYDQRRHPRSVYSPLSRSFFARD